jgi:hypothetical protein
MPPLMTHQSPLRMLAGMNSSTSTMNISNALDAHNEPTYIRISHKCSSRIPKSTKRSVTLHV